MADEVKVDVKQTTFSLKLEDHEISGMESSEVVSAQEYQFTTDGELGMQQYQDDNEQGARAVDIIDRFVIDSDSQVFEAVDSNAYVTASIDDGGPGEQFLTIPRGRTQITVCDNGNIVYTDDSLLDNTAEQSNEKHSSDGDQTTYYQAAEENDASNEEPMEVEDDNTQYIQQIVDSNQLDGATFITEEEGKEYSTENFTHDETNEQDIQARAIAETVLNRSDMRKFIALQQDSARGVKRTIPSSPNKNVVTKVFIQGNPSTSSAQPITIIGSLPGSVVGSRTMSIAQAHRLGLFSPNTKGQQSGSVPSGRVLVKKVIPTSGASVLAVKQPTKILPAPSPSKARIPVIGGRGNLMPVRTNIPVSQLKMLTAISSSTTQVRPLTVAKSMTTAGDVHISPQKVYVRPATTVLSPISGQLTRIGPNTSFQPIQVKGKQSVQYVKLIGPGSGSATFSGVKPKLVKQISGRSVPISLSQSSTTSKSISTATVVGNKIILPMASSDGEKVLHLKSAPSLVPVSVKGKSFTAARSGVSFTEDNQIVVVPEDDKSDSQEEIEELCDKENLEGGHTESVLEANGIRPKKPCNCTKSQCLKLYCECFANGEFCFQCNCNNCFNNIEHEDERQLSIQSCLERNPSAFRPKFQLRESEEEDRRNKGCNCRRSGCFKNYCECFEAKISCSKICKCQGCKNTEEEMEAHRKSGSGNEEEEDENGVKTPKFMSASLTEALCQCMLAQAEKAERNGDDVETTERRIIEEFGQCIVQIIGNRNKRDAR